MEIVWKVISWEGEGGEGEKVQGLRSIIESRQGYVKHKIGSGEAKELI